MRLIIAILSLSLIILIPCHLNGQTAITPQETEIGIEEHLDEYVPLDIMVIDEKTQTTNLAALIDKPTIINLVYYRCPGICSPLMEGLANVMDKVDLELGKDYQVLTISFDPRESIELAHRKKNNYLNLMSNPEPAREHWKFFISDSANIAKLTNAVGFKYKRTGNDYLHAASIVIVSPDGKITRYLNGTYFLPFEITMAITEASQGISAPTVNRILQFCFAYDPVGQRYALSMTRVALPIISVSAVIIVLILVFRTSRKKKIQP
ncbi:MAG: SCO family protein [Bacteroidales bacterium]